MSDPRAPLHPQIETLFSLLAANRSERVLDAQALRAGLGALAPLLNAGGPEAARREERRIPGDAGEIRALVFWPKQPARGPWPVILLLHGGGYVVMSPETHERLARELATGAGAIVVSADYRLAPEHPYPAPLDDCVAVFRWLRAHARELDGDPERIAVAGDSAGGNASAALCLRSIAAGEAPPRAALLICPWLDMRLESESMRRYGPDDPLIDSALMRYFRDSYVSRQQISDPFASPVLADVAGFPETLIVVGTIDPLHDDGVLFARRLEAAGRKVTLSAHAGMPHDFVLFPGIDEATKTLEQMCGFLARVLRASV